MRGERAGRRAEGTKGVMATTVSTPNPADVAQARRAPAVCPGPLMKPSEHPGEAPGKGKGNLKPSKRASQE